MTTQPPTSEPSAAQPQQHQSETTPGHNQSEDIPRYDDSRASNESGSGAAEEAANQPTGEPELDHRGVPTLPATGTVGSADPQSASAARVLRESAVGGGGVYGTGASPAQGQAADPPPAPEGAGQPDIGVADTPAGVPVDQGRKAGAPNATEVVGTVRPHAPDGEVSPT